MTIVVNTNQKYSAIQHHLTANMQNLTKGTYFVHYQSKGVSKTRKLLKY